MLIHLCTMIVRKIVENLRKKVNNYIKHVPDTSALQYHVTHLFYEVTKHDTDIRHKTNEKEPHSC